MAVKEMQHVAINGSQVLDREAVLTGLIIPDRSKQEPEHSTYLLNTVSSLFKMLLPNGHGGVVCCMASNPPPASHTNPDGISRLKVTKLFLLSKALQ